MRIVGLLLIVGFLLSACQSEEGDKHEQISAEVSDSTEQELYKETS